MNQPKISQDTQGVFRKWHKSVFIAFGVTNMHPHLDCLVTAGGLAYGEWIASSKTFLLPFGIVQAVFRGKYLHYLKKALDRNELFLPDGMRLQQARKAKKTCGATESNARSTLSPPSVNACRF